MNSFTDSLKNVATLGYYGRRRDAAQKALRDASTGGTFTVIRLGERGEVTRLFRKPNVQTLRGMAEHSVWIRAAVDIYRGAIGQAKWQIIRDDETRPMNERVRRDIERTLNRPNKTGESYSTIKKKMVEDFLVVGHGAIEKGIRRDGATDRLWAMDAATLGFIEGWDGTDPRTPRYAQFKKSGQVVQTTVSRYLGDAHVMTLVNRARSYDDLGLSHVEALHRAVTALLEADDYLLRQIVDAAPAGAFDLGEGTSQEQADQVRQQIQAVRKAFVVIGGTKGAQFVRFNGTEREMRLLDQQAWFVRQVAAIFQISTAKLRLAVDLSRANAKEMFDDDQEGPAALLWDVQEAEQRQIVESHGPVEEHNCRIHYAILGKRDERKVAEVTSIQMGRGSWISVNDARRTAGMPVIEGLKIANEILIPTKAGPVPLSKLEEQYFGGGQSEGDEEEEEDAAKDDTGDVQDQGDDSQA